LRHGGAVTGLRGALRRRRPDRSGPRLRTIEPGLVEPQLLYAAADVLAAPSRSEGMPYAVIEASCSALPVVGSRIPGHDVYDGVLHAALRRTS